MSAWTMLGLAVGATEQEIRRAYRRLATFHHPDKNPNDPSAQERFIALTAAYRELSWPVHNPPAEILRETKIHGFVVRIVCEEGYARCSLIGRRGTLYPILPASRRAFLTEFEEGRLSRAPKGYAGPRDFLFFRGTVIGILARDARLLALPVLRFEHPTIAYMVGAKGKRIWMLKRVGTELYAFDEKDHRVALGGFRVFTDLDGSLTPFGPRHFPPFEARI